MTRKSRAALSGADPLELADGRRVWVRPVRPSDVDELRRAISEADPETLRRRFLGGRAPQTDAELSRLVEVDHTSREAIAAFDDTGRGVGIARYESQPDTTAVEFAVAVDPAWRQVGLASALLTRLLRAALRNGFTTIHVDYFADNRDVADLVRRSGGRIRTDLDAGIVDADLSIEPEVLETLETSRIGVHPGGA